MKLIRIALNLHRKMLVSFNTIKLKSLQFSTTARCYWNLRETPIGWLVVTGASGERRVITSATQLSLSASGFRLHHTATYDKCWWTRKFKFPRETAHGGARGGAATSVEPLRGSCCCAQWNVNLQLCQLTSDDDDEELCTHARFWLLTRTPHEQQKVKKFTSFDRSSRAARTELLSELVLRLRHGEPNFAFQMMLVDLWCPLALFWHNKRLLDLKLTAGETTNWN